MLRAAFSDSALEGSSYPALGRHYTAINSKRTQPGGKTLKTRERERKQNWFPLQPHEKQGCSIPDGFIGQGNTPAGLHQGSVNAEPGRWRKAANKGKQPLRGKFFLESHPTSLQLLFIYPKQILYTDRISFALKRGEGIISLKAKTRDYLYTSSTKLLLCCGRQNSLVKTMSLGPELSSSTFHVHMRPGMGFLPLQLSYTQNILYTKLLTSLEC